MASKRKAKGKTIPGIEESFLGFTSSFAPKKMRTSKSNKRKVLDSIPTEKKGKISVRIKKRAASDSGLSVGNREENIINDASNLKIEAFDYFHQMLNHCCGSQMFNVPGTASILKQFTPDIMKTIIYVIAENSKKVLTEAQTQTQDKSDEFHDMEITRITSKAGQKRGQGKWQPILELVQPRLTSPTSNSCSPVSAAVQALMSFARNEDPTKKKSEGSGSQQNDGTEKDGKQGMPNLNVFESNSLASVSSSPFLQPMSSSLMLHTEVTKPEATAAAIRAGADNDKSQSPSSFQSVSTATPRPPSPSFPFPWIKLPNKHEYLEKLESSKHADKNLPSISSILAPIGSNFPDLNFQGMTMMGTSPSLVQSKVTTSVLEVNTQRGFKSSLRSDASSVGVIVPGTLGRKKSSQKVSSPSVTLNAAQSKTAKRSSRKAAPPATHCQPEGPADREHDAQKSSKTVFRKILPKPSSKKKIASSNAKLAEENEMQKSAEDTDSEALLGHPGPLPNENLMGNSEMRTFMTGSRDAQEEMSKGSQTSIAAGKNAKTTMEQKQVLSAVPSHIVDAAEEKVAEGQTDLLTKPLASVISSMREQGFVITGLPPEPHVVSSKQKKSSSSNSGKLEVASALLSMGSTENEVKKRGKVVATFNRQKATFDIKESTSAQHGDILFTKTGTFQIEDIEIDPKKNKIEKDSYECGKCGRVFTSLVYLARHIKRVCPDMSLRKWRCDRCEKAFRHPFGLQQHIYTHTGERPFKCDQCAKAFYSANDLRRHTRTHSGERPYTCSHCKKCFSTTISLKTHTYIHTGERPHKCPHCPKTFATSSKLSRHVVTHSDRRPFACDICIKTFNRSGDLRRHYNNVHNLEHGLLSCDQCNKLFATQKCLQNHKSTHNRRLRTDLESLSEAGDVVKFSELLPGKYTIKPSSEE